MIKEAMAIIEDLILIQVLLKLNLKTKKQIKKDNLKLILFLKTIYKNLLKTQMKRTLMPQNLKMKINPAMKMLKL